MCLSGISRLGCLGESDRSSARSFKTWNMLALMLVETVKSCRSNGDWGHDRFFHLPAVSIIIKQRCPLNTLTRLFIGICMSIPRLHDCRHALRISYPRLKYNYQEMKVLAVLLRFQRHRGLKVSNHRGIPEPPGAGALKALPDAVHVRGFRLLYNQAYLSVFPGVLVRPPLPTSSTSLPPPPPSLSTSLSPTVCDCLSQTE